MSDCDTICARCGRPIAEGEPAHKSGSSYICEDCTQPYNFYQRNESSFYFEEAE